MKLNQYKNYRQCPCCSIMYPVTRTNFKRLVVNGKESFHLTCKKCEEKARIERECKDGKLRCHGCGEYKNEEEFTFKGSRDSARNNRRTLCKRCYAERQKERNLNLSDSKKLEKCLRFRWLGARDRSNKHTTEFSVTLDEIKALWVEQAGLCALSGIPMTYELQNGRVPTNVSIDRINSAKGYTIDNIQLVCMACNQIKSDLSKEEMYTFCKQIVDYYESKNN